MSLLAINNLTVARGGTQVVRNVSLDVQAGTITVLLGPNGAGKSTLLDAIAGVVSTEAGTLELDGSPLDGLSTRQRFQRGIGYVDQGRTVFPGLTVRKNIEAAAPDAASARKGLEMLLSIFPELEKRLGVAAGMLSGGEQQMIVLGRAIMNRPRLLLIDELSLGLAPLIVQRFMPLLTQLRNDGVGILLVEQYANAALAIGDGAAVLAHGEVVLTDSCESLLNAPERLQRAYLG